MVTVICPPGSPTYTGSAITPACTATATGAGSLSVSVTQVNFSNNTSAGRDTTSTCGWSDAIRTANHGSANFTIAQAPSTVTVICPPGSPTYTGSARTAGRRGREKGRGRWSAYD